MSEVHGLLLVDKPSGMTSHDVVGKIRRYLGQKSVGHAGTLDPMATGLLVILCGHATKLSDYILKGDKSYSARVLLGKVTDTDDVTGQVLSEKSVDSLDKIQIEKAVNNLAGEQSLLVPIYSAVKSKGKKLYQLARENKPVTPPMKTMIFHRLDIEEIHSDSVQVHMDCSKGSYVRSWARKLGEDLGVGGTLQELRRTGSEPYKITESIPLDQLIEGKLEDLQASVSWIPLEEALPYWPTVQVEGKDEKLLSNGQIPWKLERYLEIEYGGLEPVVPGVKILSRRTGQILSLVSQEEPARFKIRRVFSNSSSRA